MLEADSIDDSTDRGENAPEDHGKDCPVCSDHAPWEVVQMRALLRACMPTACPPTLKARIVREVRFVALTFRELNEEPDDN
ncbi:MAG: hypothetical protein WAS54_08580 [Scrofimicrobium sp.]